MEIDISGRKIGPSYPGFITAEAGVNDIGGFGLANRLVDTVADAKADPLKFQTFKTERVVISAKTGVIAGFWRARYLE